MVENQKSPGPGWKDDICTLRGIRFRSVVSQILGPPLVFSLSHHPPGPVKGKRENNPTVRIKGKRKKKGKSIMFIIIQFPTLFPHRSHPQTRRLATRRSHRPQLSAVGQDTLNSAPFPFMLFSFFPFLPSPLSLLSPFLESEPATLPRGFEMAEHRACG